MILHSDKKVICVRDIPSNIIDEAIFILKENVIENEEEETDERTKEIILKEAEDIVEEYVNKIEYEEDDDAEEYQAEGTNIMKEIIYVAGLLIILAICIIKVI